MQAYSSNGMFGLDKTRIPAIVELAKARESVLDKHLNVMDQIKARGHR